MPLRTGPAFRVVMGSTPGDTLAALGERVVRAELAAAGIDDRVIRVTAAGPVADADLILTSSRAESAQVTQHSARARRRTFTIVEYLRLSALLDPVAPLREVPLMLSEARGQANLTAADDLPGPATGDAANAALTARLADLAQDLVGRWADLTPASGRHDAHPAPAVPDDSRVMLQIFGVRVDVLCTGGAASDLATAMRGAWGRCLRAEGEDADFAVEAMVDDDLERLHEARTGGAVAAQAVGDAMHALSSVITVRAIDARAGEAIMLHAAGLALPDGRVVTFVAPSGTGKTTLSRALGRHYGYVSDETVFVGFDGAVTPYPKPLSVIVEGVRGKEQVSPDADSLLPPPSVPLRLAGIVLLTRVPDAGPEPVVERVPLLEGIVELAAQISYLPRVPSPLQSLARVIEGAGGLQRVTYSEAESLARLVPLLAGAPA